MEYKSGFVTLIGRPNVGKSTLINCLVGHKISITSNKFQTTRMEIQAVFTNDNGQIVFIDTPGIQKNKNKFDKYMENVTKKSICDVDIILWVVDPSTFIGVYEKRIALKLTKINVPIFLVINKIDIVNQSKVYNCINAYKEFYNFQEIIAISSIQYYGINELRSRVFKYLPYGPQYYDPNIFTNQSKRQIMEECIREKALYNLNYEIPYGIVVTIDYMEYRKSGINSNCIVDIYATIFCERNSHKKIIIGKKGNMIKKIGSNARCEMEKLLQHKVNLNLLVKVEKDWRNNDSLICNFCYKKI